MRQWLCWWWWCWFFVQFFISFLSNLFLWFSGCSRTAALGSSHNKPLTIKQIITRKNFILQICLPLSLSLYFQKKLINYWFYYRQLLFYIEHVKHSTTTGIYLGVLVIACCVLNQAKCIFFSLYVHIIHTYVIIKLSYVKKK